MEKYKVVEQKKSKSEFLGLSSVSLAPNYVSVPSYISVTSFLVSTLEKKR
ncbi:hypothetical protein [[Mycoplasma] testudinis]|nr:hypothetical protein [[Mycoplasma] testudinis]